MAHEDDIIQAFRRAMAEHDIRTDDKIIADGKFHRMHVEGDKKKSRNGWYVLHLDGVPSGAFGCNKRYGNEAKFTWTGKGIKPLTTEERLAFRRRMEAQRAEREAEQRRLHEAAKTHANFMWDQAQPLEGDDHPYLKRKGVKSHGLRVGPWEKIDHDNGTVDVLSERALLIPARDTSKVIRSMQAIFPAKLYGDRDKDYLKNGVKEGNFFAIGRPQTVEFEGQQRKVIMIGEGYATVASAHEATGHAGIVAFDAGNLLPVAKALRAKFPDFLFVFLADNDQWTKPTPENPHIIENPGLTKASEAAKAVGGLVALPPFAHDAEGRPTDFNDLQQLRGREAVAEVIMAVFQPKPAGDIAEEIPPWEGEAGSAPALAAPLPDPVADDERPENNSHFTILGYNRGTYYIFQHRKCQIAEITKGDMSEIGLIELADLTWWEMKFPGEKSRIDTKAAAQFIIRTAEKRGIYDTSKIRGRGAWTDEGRMVYHHGSYLTVDGEPTDITAIRSRYVYELDKSLPFPADEPLSDEDGKKLLNLASMFRWSKPGSAAILAGWVALAPMCGALRWRPHIWLTGGAGCGKSTVLNEYAHYLLGGLNLYAQGNSSEAGIRQKLRADARPVLFDESESNEESDARRVQNVLSLIRQSSTESEAQTLKGTAGGESMSFHIRSMFCLASIQVALKHQADVERLTVLGLRPKREDPDAATGWEKLSAALRDIKIDRELPARLFRRSMDLLPVTLKNIETFSHAAAMEFGSQRDGDQYGTLLAGAWSLISKKEATHEQAVAMIRRYDWSEHREQNDSDEGQRALTALMEAHVRIKGGIEVTVYELVCSAFGEPTEMADLTQPVADAILQRHGMKVKGDRLLLSNNSQELRRLMAGSSFEADYRGVLLRVPGADRNDNKPVKFSGVQNKCISLPLGPIVTKDNTGPAF